MEDLERKLEHEFVILFNSLDWIEGGSLTHIAYANEISSYLVKQKRMGAESSKFFRRHESYVFYQLNKKGYKLDNNNIIR